MQHSVPHSMVRLVAGVMTGCGVLMLNTVYADTVLKDTEARVDVKPEAKSGLISNVMSKTGDVVMSALGIVGPRYRFGGNTSESGLDCSGFTRYVFNDTFGSLPSYCTVKMSRVGISADTVELRPGDLVFFNIIRHIFPRVDIYIGDNKFMYAPSTSSKIHVDDMTALYWVARYNDARHIEDNSDTAIKDGADNFVKQLKRVDSSATGKPLAMYGG